MKLVSVAEMLALEERANRGGLTYAMMMQNAGTGLAKLVAQLGREKNWQTVTGIVGSGKNGGDTLIALTHLGQQGWWARAYLVGRNLEDELLRQFVESGGEAAHFPSAEALQVFLNESNVLLDGLLGTGIKLPLRSEAAQVLNQIKQALGTSNLFVIAVDCPSGVDCNSGAAAAETLPASLTATMAAVKRGLLKLPAFEWIGALKAMEIGLPAVLLNTIKDEVADSEMVSAILPKRTAASHKGTFGTAFVVAGSTAYTGAALLAGKAAYRIGAGLVTVATPAPVHGALAGHLPEAAWVLLPHENGFISDQAVEVALQGFERATAFLMGPGLGAHLCTQMFVEDLLPSVKIPMVVDADGLRHLAQHKDWPERLANQTVLTPHPGEMSALTGLSKEEIQNNREEIARKFAQEWGHVVVLKGAFTVIAAPNGRVTIIPVATPALARAGTGDALAGMIVGLLAQGVPPYDAAVAGAYIHAQAGLHAAQRLGSSASVLAGDVVETIATVLSGLAQIRA
ncbi:MAG: NAD(P)H-hydrate dehydratase [Anaerolineales bacterium]|nr:NAD(P)H-hydrate dehydratase [Anaerolineales bacterium]